MPATKKKKVVRKAAKAVMTSTVMEKKVEKVSEQMNLLLVIFSLAMMVFAYVLYTTYAM